MSQDKHLTPESFEAISKNQILIRVNESQNRMRDHLLTDILLFWISKPFSVEPEQFRWLHYFWAERKGQPPSDPTDLTSSSELEDLRKFWPNESPREENLGKLLSYWKKGRGFSQSLKYGCGDCSFEKPIIHACRPWLLDKPTVACRCRGWKNAFYIKDEYHLFEDNGCEEISPSDFFLLQHYARLQAYLTTLIGSRGTTDISRSYLLVAANRLEAFLRQQNLKWQETIGLRHPLP